MTVHPDMFDSPKGEKKMEQKATRLTTPSYHTTPTVMVSGGFDPIHGGHIQMITEAAKHGNVIVVANSDAWLMRKKGYVFMSFEERRKILKEIKGVILVAAVDDADGTVCDALHKLRPDYFANGGDRGKNNTPEQKVCEELEIEMLWGIGGDYKFNSSSDLARNLIKNYPK